MNWCRHILWEIKYWLKWNWVGISVGLILLAVVCPVIWKMLQTPTEVLFPPRIEQITDIVEGELISIRATGAFNISDTELKFEDGSMILVTYGFSRRNKLKAGHHYKIWYSSFYGQQCKEIKRNE